MNEAPRVYFGVFSFNGDPSAVTEALDLDPYQTWCQGDPGPLGVPRTHDRWEFRGTKCEAASFEDQLDELLDILETRQDMLRGIAGRFEFGIRCTASYRETVNPGFHLSELAIRRLADLGLSCDFDLYLLGGRNDM